MNYYGENYLNNSKDEKMRQLAHQQLIRDGWKPSKYGGYEDPNNILRTDVWIGPHGEINRSM